MSEDDSVDQVIWAIRQSPFDKHAQEIGRVCILWSQLELTMAGMLGDLMAIEDATVKNVVISSLDMRGKMQAILPIAFSKKRSDSWFSQLQTEINEIDNKLRPERNRLIHDYWIVMPDTVHRMQHTATVVRDQRTQLLKLAEHVPVSVGDLLALQIKIAKASGRIQELADQYAGRPTLREIFGKQPLPRSPTPDQSPSAPESPPEPSEG